jgi:hypothetical protein
MIKKESSDLLAFHISYIFGLHMTFGKVPDLVEGKKEQAFPHRY